MLKRFQIILDSPDPLENTLRRLQVLLHAGWVRLKVRQPIKLRNTPSKAFWLLTLLMLILLSEIYLEVKPSKTPK
jgi:hypothetical protein